jgi:hypothetical protein
MGGVVYDPVAGKLNLYASPDDKIMNLYTSSDGTTWTAFGSNPVWQPSQVSGVSGVTFAANMGVLRVDATHWYGYYSIRSSSQGVLTSIRYCTSTDGKAWTDGGAGNPLLTTTAATYYSTYLEGMNQIITDGAGGYGIVTSCYDGTTWTCGLATGSSPTGPFTLPAAPMFQISSDPGAWDRGVVASPSIYNLNGSWWLFYSGSIGQIPYTNAYYNIGLAQF